jgi:hypothetical protein
VAEPRVLHEVELSAGPCCSASDRVSTIALVAADVESARRDWEDAHSQLQEEMRTPARAEPLRLQLEVLTDELRKRVGGTFTLSELAAEYRHAEAWAREVVSERAAGPEWPRTLSVVEGAAFHRYARGAVDYVP